MKRLTAIVAAALVALTVFGCAGSMTGQGWVTLIDGDKGMDNWNIAMSAGNWRAEGGAIMADKSAGKGASVLVSKQAYKDFELYAEFWADHGTNSGIYIRAPNPALVNTASGAYEVQIWDKNPNPAYSTGSLVNVASVNPIYKAGGKWNIYEIYAKGSEITVKLNGVVTASTQSGKNINEGRIGIQFNPDTGPIKVRKLMVRPL